ncbi:hypothetical protein QN357_13475, partial [Cryobacterium sp. RTC2.1]
MNQWTVGSTGEPVRDVVLKLAKAHESAFGSAFGAGAGAGPARLFPRFGAEAHADSTSHADARGGVRRLVQESWERSLSLQ